MAPPRAERDRAAIVAPSIKAAPATKADLARQRIQELILAGGAGPGHHLTTRQIAEDLAISETPVREAMRSLAAEGWLDFHPRHGAVVAETGGAQLVEIYALRGTLGALAIELCGADYPPGQLAAIDANLAQSAAAVAAADIDAYARLNRAFHLLLSDTPRTRLTLRQLTLLWTHTAAARRGFEVIPGRLAASLAEHRAIRAAIADRNPAEAAALLIAHERTAGTALIAALAGETERVRG